MVIAFYFRGELSDLIQGRISFPQLQHPPPENYRRQMGDVKQLPY